jgi:hypothetical protein
MRNLQPKQRAFPVKARQTQSNLVKVNQGNEMSYWRTHIGRELQNPCSMAEILKSQSNPVKPGQNQHAGLTVKPGRTPSGQTQSNPVKPGQSESRAGEAALNPHISHLPVRSADFQSAFTVIASAKPTASRRSRMLALGAVHEISGLTPLPAPCFAGRRDGFPGILPKTRMRAACHVSAKPIDSARRRRILPAL